MKVYTVNIYGGEYEDQFDYVDRICDSLDNAIQYAKELVKGLEEEKDEYELGIWGFAEEVRRIYIDEWELNIRHQERKIHAWYRKDKKFVEEKKGE